MKNVLVTGGAGFIGGVLCKVLAQNSYNPIIIDDLSTGYVENAKYGKLFVADFGDYDEVVKILKEFKPIAIFHIAASKDVAESIRNPFKYQENNVDKTNILIEAALDCDIKNFVFSSSAAIFGEINGSQKVAENYKPDPINPYGASKLKAEKLFENYEKFGLVTSSLRYFNVSGADVDAEIGERNPDASNIFPILSKAAFYDEEFTVFGDNYNTKDGSCIRDYIHVYDLVCAHISAFEKQIETKKSVKINLGNGVGFSVLELIENFEKISGKKIKTKLGARRAGDPESVVCDISFAKKYLNFKSKYPKITDHILHQWNFYKKINEK